MNETSLIDLKSLNNGLPTLSSAWGTFLAEAGLYCLETSGHQSGVELGVRGDEPQSVILIWEKETDSRMINSWKEDSEAVEYGATCIAILLSVNFTEHITVERSAKGTGIDYWLGTVNNNSKEDILPFQKKARLEISGIRKGNDYKINKRVEEKREQAKKSASSGLPAYIAVIEFGNPLADFSKR
jgi:hypothetical protein